MNDCVLRAVALALRDVPAAAVYWDEVQGAAAPFASIDISVAVATERGLITPIVKVGAGAGRGAGERRAGERMGLRGLVSPARHGAVRRLGRGPAAVGRGCGGGRGKGGFITPTEGVAKVGGRGWEGDGVVGPGKDSGLSGTGVVVRGSRWSGVWEERRQSRVVQRRAKLASKAAISRAGAGTGR